MFERLITDNILIAFETMHHINQKKLRKVREMVVKLDMSKAYDWVEWGCLENIMLKMGIHVKWINILMRCVRSISYSIKINVRPRGRITPTRIAPKRPPFSLLIFDLCRGLICSFNKNCGGWFTKRCSSVPKRASNITLVFCR